MFNYFSKWGIGKKRKRSDFPELQISWVKNAKGHKFRKNSHIEKSTYQNNCSDELNWNIHLIFKLDSFKGQQRSKGHQSL